MYVRYPLAHRHHPDLHTPVRRQAGDQRVAVLVLAFDHRLDAAAPDRGDPVGGHAFFKQVVAHAVRAAGRQRDVGVGVADPVAVAAPVAAPELGRATWWERGGPYV